MIFFPAQRDPSYGLLTIFNKHRRMAGFIGMDQRWINHNIDEGTNITIDRLFTFVALSIGSSDTLDGYEQYVDYQVSHNIISNRDLPEGVPGIRTMRAWWKKPMPRVKLGGVGYVGDRTKDVRYYDADKKPIERTPMVNVMLIEQNGDAARRLGIGKMYLARWKDAEPKMSPILLE